MYKEIHTNEDVIRERYIYGSELVGMYDLPQLPRACGLVTNELKSVPFNLARKERDPKHAVCHFFLHDQQFERIWTHPDKYIPILQNYKWVCCPDFSCYGDMPLALRVWQTYRNRAISWYLYMSKVNIIPTVGWNDEESFKWRFDGMPTHSILAVSTNGCHSKASQRAYREGFHEMCKRLEPNQIVCVGKPIEVDDNVDIIYLDSVSQQIAKRR